MKNIRIIFTICLLSFSFMGFSSEKDTEGNVQSEIKTNLNSVLPEGISVLSIQKSHIEGYLEVLFDGLEPLYVTEDGKYLISGDFFQITSNGIINKSELQRNYLRKTSLDEIDESEFITFEPKYLKHKIYVFTDVDCGYCRQFHREIDDYLALGIQVNYLAFPRTGLDSESFNKITSAWCSKDPNQALTLLKLGDHVEQNICKENPVEKHFRLGGNFGVSGTPSIITSEGKMIPGYVSAQDLIGLL